MGNGRGQHAVWDKIRLGLFGIISPLLTQILPKCPPGQSDPGEGCLPLYATKNRNVHKFSLISEVNGLLYGVKFTCCSGFSDMYQCNGVMTGDSLMTRGTMHLWTTGQPARAPSTRHSWTQPGSVHTPSATLTSLRRTIAYTDPEPYIVCRLSTQGNPLAISAYR